MIRKVMLVLFTFLLFGIGIDSVNASAPYISSMYNSDFPYLYGVYCPYAAVAADGTLVTADNGRPKLFYNILYFGNAIDDVFEFDFNYNQTIQNELGIVIENGSPGKALSDETQISWLREKGFISSDGKWSCPDLDDSEDKNGDGYTKYRSFVIEDGSGSICKASDNSCVVSDIPVSEKINYTCTYTGQTSGKTLTINVFENDNGEIVRNVTYPDGISQTKNSGIILDEDCSEDIYYVYEKRLIKFSTFTNDKVSNNTTLWNLCRDYKENQIEHFCAGECNYEEMTCSDTNNSISAGSNSDSNSINSNPDGCYGLLPIVKFIRRGVFSIIQIGIPILLIIMGTIDLAKAVISSDDQEIKKSTSKFIKRAICAIAVFFIVTIVSLIMNLIADNTTTENGDVNKNWKDCWNTAE